MYNFPLKTICIRNLKSRNFLIPFFFTTFKETHLPSRYQQHTRNSGILSFFFTSVLRAAIVRSIPEPLHTFRGRRISCMKKCRQMAPTPFRQAKTHLFFSFSQQPCFFRGAGVFNFLNFSILYDTLIERYDRLNF